MKLHALSIDAEFTTFDMLGGDMISFAAVEILEYFSLGRDWTGNFKPRSDKYFTEEARKIHGFSYFKALEFPEKKKSLLDLLHWLSPRISGFPLTAVYWGSWAFDIRWLEFTFKEEDLQGSFYKAFGIQEKKHISAMSLAKKNLKQIKGPDGGEKGRYTLNNVASFYNIELDHHNALSDARATAEIYCKIMKKEDVWTGEMF